MKLIKVYKNSREQIAIYREFKTKPILRENNINRLFSRLVSFEKEHCICAVNFYNNCYEICHLKKSKLHFNERHINRYLSLKYVNSKIIVTVTV